MSASRCMHHARRIQQSPPADWGRLIDSLPTACPHADCGQPKNCQQRIREYLRMQYRITAALEARQRAGRGRK